MELREGAGAGPEVSRFLRERGADVVARRGELVDALARPAVVASEAGAVAGVLTYDVVERSCEILTPARRPAVVRRPGAVDEARRTLEPQIGLIGEYGIAIRDEIELARELGGATGRTG